MQDDILRNPDITEFLIDEMTHLLFVVDCNLEIIFLNDSCVKRFGISEECFKEKNILDIISIDSRVLFSDTIKKSISNNKKYQIKTDIIINNNQYSRIQWDIKPLPNRQFIIIGKDICDIPQKKSSIEFNELMMQKFLDNVPALIFIKDINGKYLMTNKYFNEIFTIKKGLDKDTDVYDSNNINLTETFKQEDSLVIRQKKTMSFDNEFFYDNQYYLYHTIKFPITDKNGKVCSVCGFSIDVTSHRNTLNALKSSKARFKSIVETAVEGILILNKQYHTTLINNRLTKMLGYSHGEIITRPFTDFIHNKDKNIVTHLINNIKDDVIFKEIRVVKSDGSKIWVKAGFTKYIKEQKDDDEFLVVISDITYLKEAQKLLTNKNKQLKKLAQTDGLTRLLNHKNIYQRLNERINESKRYKKELSIIMLDIDHFKNINDKYGHIFGDEVLKKVAKALKNSVRETDFLGRYGGEEFLLVLPETGIDQSKITAERIKNNVMSIQWDKPDLKVTISGGISLLYNENAKSLVKKADDKLYLAKNNGRNRIEF